jgi:hypothetical protein
LEFPHAISLSLSLSLISLQAGGQLIPSHSHTSSKPKRQTTSRCISLLSLPAIPTTHTLGYSQDENPLVPNATITITIRYHLSPPPPTAPRIPRHKQKENAKPRNPPFTSHRRIPFSTTPTYSTTFIIHAPEPRDKPRRPRYLRIISYHKPFDIFQALYVS